KKQVNEADQRMLAERPHQFSTALPHDGLRQIFDGLKPERGQHRKLALLQGLVTAVMKELRHFRSKTHPEADGVQRQQCVVNTLGMFNGKVHTRILSSSTYAAALSRPQFADRFCRSCRPYQIRQSLGLRRQDAPAEFRE